METNKNLVGKTVFVVMEDWRSHVSDEETSIKGVYATKEDAEKCVSSARDNIISEWGDMFDFDSESDDNEFNPYEVGYLDNEEDWSVESASADNYTIARTSDYDYYYSVYIVEQKIM